MSRASMPASSHASSTAWTQSPRSPIGAVPRRYIGVAPTPTTAVDPRVGVATIVDDLLTSSILLGVGAERRELAVAVRHGWAHGQQAGNEGPNGVLEQHDVVPRNRLTGPHKVGPAVRIRGPVQVAVGNHGRALQGEAPGDVLRALEQGLLQRWFDAGSRQQSGAVTEAGHHGRR